MIPPGTPGTILPGAEAAVVAASVPEAAWHPNGRTPNPKRPLQSLDPGNRLKNLEASSSPILPKNGSPGMIPPGRPGMILPGAEAAVVAASPAAAVVVVAGVVVVGAGAAVVVAAGAAVVAS